MKSPRPSSLTPTPSVPRAFGGGGKASRPQVEGPQAKFFDEMAAQHLGALYRTALRLTGGRPQDAEDLVQETCLRAWRSLHTYRPNTNAKAWLSKILRNVHIDRFRASSHGVETVALQGHERAPVVYDTPESLVMAGQMDAEVRQALAGVPEVFRACVILADLQGFSHPEIVDVLGVPRGTVMSRLFRGRRAMRRVLTAYGREHGYLKAS